VIQRVIHLLMAIGFAVLFSEGHGAKANDADAQIAAPKTPVLHMMSFQCMM
jgi:hypothetical protein